ncbi:MBL fold metallo-hydrolase RNA specificity domain-containing protein [Vogesella sp. LIG4]|uniref:MBL fold metallo-hydrolase RNA specificity domain-containing protein n=1 Tax=Vogesella sp. LIG4 TaxID=1192162 RepID=UPI00081FEACD|nr:MBL fold metallo-hydrolase [Vogesella sp. LIG4]SCK21648.1 metallo-beta-lactamase family protein [Vogesella sp. LIG4]
MQLTFLGAAGTVTGSKYLLECAGKRILLDCGLFQGFKQLRLRNWRGLPFSPAELDAVVLTHAHLDHSGYLPALVRDGFRGSIHATGASCALAGILLPDSGFLQEEEAEYANRRGFSKHSPALPLYTQADAEKALEYFSPLPFHQRSEILPGIEVLLRPAGHILGAASVEIRADGVTLLASGDLGRQHDPIMKPPEQVAHADYLLLESTYGNRQHPPEDPEQVLCEVINRTVARRGITVIPAFAVERAQVLMYFLYRLKRAGKLPARLPIYLNSPMASDVTGVYQQFRDSHRLSDEECEGMCQVAHMVRTVEESKRLNELREPAVIIAASGMATGGRVLHHLKAFAPNPRNTLLFTGFQAGGTRGALIVGGAPSVRIHGEDVPINAEVIAMDHMSAHADSNEILQWLSGFEQPPRHSFIVHGEPEAADALRRRISHEKHWQVSVAEQDQHVTLD